MAANMMPMGSGGPAPPRQRPPQNNWQAMVYNTMLNNPIHPNGWQQGIGLQQRMASVLNLISNSFLVLPTMDSNHIVNMNISYEADALANSPDKAAYEHKINGRLQELFRKRQANEPHIQNSLQQHHMAQQAQAQAHAQAQQMMINNPQLQAQMARGMMQPGQQGFQHLQQQMQASPIPQQPQQGQMGMGMANPGSNPMNPNQQAMQMGGQQIRPPMQQPNIMANAQRVALTKFSHMTDAEKNHTRMRLQQQMPPHILQQWQQNGGDPVLHFLQQQYIKHVQQRNQQPGATAPGGDLGPFSNEIMNQQKAGLMAQEAGQMVVPASSGPGRNATPQPNPQGPNQAMQRPPSIPQQQFNMQQAQQLKMDQAAQQSQAQIRAQAHAKQMQGQPGGLSGPGGVSQSPGMNTLNTPVSRPPVAMGQERQQPQMNPPFGQALDPRFNQNQRPPMGNSMNVNPMMDQANKQQMIQAIMNSLPPDQRAQLRNMPPDRVNEFIMMRVNNAARQSQMAGRPPSQPGQFGPGNPMAQFVQGNAMGQPVGMGVQNNMLVQQQINRMRAANGQNPGIPMGTMAMMDQMDVPHKILEQVPGAPPDIKKWAQLKQWMSTASLAPQIPAQLHALQIKMFREIVKQRQAQGAQGAPGQPLQGPTGQQQKPPGPLPDSVTVSPQEIQNLKNLERFKNIPEDDIRNYILNTKRQQLAKRMAQAQQPPQPQPQTQPQSQPQPQPQIQPQPQPQPHPQASRPASATPVPTPQGFAMGGAPRPANNVASEQTVLARANKQPSNNNRQTPQQSASPAIPPKNGLKRPSSDDIEVPNSAGTAVQRQVTAPSPLHLANLSAEQRQKYEQMMKNRLQVNEDDMKKLRKIGQEEASLAANTVFPEIPMNPDQYTTMVKALQHLWGNWCKVGKHLARWYSAMKDDNRARMYFKYRNLLLKQFKDEKTGTGDLKPVLTMGPHDVESCKRLIESMGKDVMAMEMKNKQQNTSELVPQPGGSVPAGTATQPVPLSVANLEKNTQALSKMNQRSGSHNEQPPPAPTTSQPPAPGPFGISAPSPHGQPSYAGKPAFTQNDLQLPAHARKKAKIAGSAANTSPQVSKRPSPEIQKKQPPPDTRFQFQCSEPGCDSHPLGFATEAALQTHVIEEHVKPREDPAKFAIESFADILGVEVDGRPKQAMPDGNTNSKSVAMAGNPSRHGQSAVSMARGASMMKQESSIGSQVAEASKVASSKGVTSTRAEEKAVPQQMSTDMHMATTIDPQDLYHNMGALESGGGGAISDMSVYRSITPNDTPESIKDSATSEPNSDVSEGVALNVSLDLGMDEWEPFGGGQYVNMDAAMRDGSDVPAMNEQVGEFISWDDVHIDFNKPFEFDSSMYLLDTN